MAKFKSNAMEDFTKCVMKALSDTEGETLPWVKPWREIDTCYRNAYSNRPYKGLHNILSCMLSGYSDPRFMTFNQMKKNGGRLKEGEKSTRLIAWKFSVIEETDKNGKKKKKTVPFAKQHCLFNIEQIDGIELPPIDLGLIDDEMEPNEDVMKILETLNVVCEHKKSNRAYYHPLEDKIVIPLVGQYKEVDQWCNTVLHELIHWTASRVNRDCSNYGFDIEERALEELVAELGAMFLCMNLNINGYLNQQNLAYVKHWKNATKSKKGEKLIYKACKLAEEAALYILKNSGMIKEEKEDDANSTADAA